ncbi:hypothetical protein [Actinomadura sp. WMMA1423]|uniref:hypothetical protein n=1 Tax=Actinomadura sp. WMMA1423 TaxID=2591108 RepID=UPI0011476D70|nr:hypothetical protein [Actinomadura sp. WMMA1423]
MINNQPEESGTTEGKRATRNARAAEREREAQYGPALQLIGEELSTLVDLRGRIARARAIATRQGHVDIVAALDGQLAPFRGCFECGDRVAPGSYCPSCGLINHEEG